MTTSTISADPGIIVGNVRVQPLSDTLVRLEEKGPQGFEDRVTFTVVDRNWPCAEAREQKDEDKTIIATPRYRVVIPGSGAALKGVRVETPDGELLYHYDGEMPEVSFIPAPGEMPKAYVVPDSPRIVPPEWGATPPPAALTNDPHSGWDITNQAPDIYVFIPGEGGYEQLRKDFLKLTGPIPLPPLYTFGLMASRYHPYTEKTALEVIDTYRRKGIPLDVFIVDTDWRVGASHGYEVDKKLFPDMERFIREAHDRRVFIMFNDHPEPFSENTLDPSEFRVRYEGLASLTKMGVDVWWFDRNWHTCIGEPCPGLRKEVWGMRVFHDMTKRIRPERRPLIMSNVQGIDHGRRCHASHPAAHRFPVWWTGDTLSKWEFLKMGVANGVDCGLISLLPYVNEDLGGHEGAPSPELYVRFLQFGALSPVTRPHCTRGYVRYPWAFGETAEQIATDYIRLRYRLMPTIYAAARRAYDDGTPILRRCDLYWPKRKEAADPQQYLFGDDLLVAPVTSSQFADSQPVGEDMLRTADGAVGLKAEYFDNRELKGKPTLVRVDRTVDFNWKHESPAPGLPTNHFSVRWTGRLGPVPKSGKYLIGSVSDDGVRIWLDGEALIDCWRNQRPAPRYGSIELEKGRTYDIRLEYFERDGGAECALLWSMPPEKLGATRALWVPPGRWQDVWTGATVVGPKTIEVLSPLWHTPMYVREGGIVLSVPEMQHTGEKPWSTVIVDAFVPTESGESVRELYEDDGMSPGYREGECSRTAVTLARSEEGVRLNVGRMKGRFKNSLGKRSWVLRLHWPKGKVPGKVVLDGRELPLKPNAGAAEEACARLIEPTADRKMPFMGRGACPAAQAGNVLEVYVPDRATDEEVELKIENLII